MLCASVNTDHTEQLQAFFLSYIQITHSLLSSECSSKKGEALPPLAITLRVSLRVLGRALLGDLGHLQILLMRNSLQEGCGKIGMSPEGMNKTEL